MDDAGDYRYARRRRAITVAVSVVATVALCVGYAVADMCDVAPGVLTLRHVEHSTAAAAGRSIEAADVVADIDASKTIDPAAARALTDAFRASAAGFGGEFSIAIADASGNVAAENNIDVPRTPASTMKTLTAYAAAVELDMGKTLDTQTYLEQSQDGTARLVLKGNGDMLLGAGASDANHINGRAGLGTLAGRTAQALRQRGITSVTLAYDDTLFGNDRWPQGIAELDTDHLYYAPTASMAVDGGNLDGVAEAKRIEFIRVRVRVAGLVALVDGQHDRLFRPLEHGRDFRIRRGQADCYIDDHDDDRRRLNGDLRLPAHKLQHFVIRTGLDAAGIDKRKPAAIPLAFAVNTVAGDAGGILDDCHALAGQFVKEHRLADVRPADDGYDGLRHGRPSFQASFSG